MLGVVVDGRLRLLGHHCHCFWSDSKHFRRFVCTPCRFGQCCPTKDVSVRLLVDVDWAPRRCWWCNWSLNVLITPRNNKCIRISAVDSRQGCQSFGILVGGEMGWGSCVGEGVGCSSGFCGIVLSGKLCWSFFFVFESVLWNIIFRGTYWNFMWPHHIFETSFEILVKSKKKCF